VQSAAVTQLLTTIELVNLAKLTKILTSDAGAGFRLHPEAIHGISFNVRPKTLPRTCLPYVTLRTVQTRR
jgi:hypothetical protein